MDKIKQLIDIAIYSGPEYAVSLAGENIITLRSLATEALTLYDEKRIEHTKFDNFMTMKVSDNRFYSKLEYGFWAPNPEADKGRLTVTITMVHEDSVIEYSVMEYGPRISRDIANIIIPILNKEANE